MKKVTPEFDSQRLMKISEQEPLPEVMGLLEYAKRAGQFIQTKLGFRNEVMSLVQAGPDETHEFCREELDEIRQVTNEFQAYQEDFENIHTQGRSLQLVRNAIAAMTFLVPSQELPQNTLLKQIISSALDKAYEILPLNDANGEQLNNPFAFIPARKTLIIGDTQEVPLTQLFSETSHLAKPLHLMKALRCNTNLYRELYSRQRSTIGPEIKAIIPFLIEALEEVIHQETEAQLNSPSPQGLNPSSYLRDISNMFEVSAALGMTYFDLLERGELPPAKLPLYPSLLEDQLDKVLQACVAEEPLSHDITSQLPPAERGSTEEDFNRAYQLILPYTRQYYFLNAKTSALVMAKMVEKKAPISQAFQSFTPAGILSLHNPSLGNLAELKPFLHYLYTSEDPDKIPIKYLMLLKPFRLSSYYNRQTPCREVDPLHHEKEISTEDISYLAIRLRQVFASAGCLADALAELFPGVDADYILAANASPNGSLVAYRLELLMKHLLSVYCGHEVYETFFKLILGNLSQKTQQQWDEQIFSVAHRFAQLIPDTHQDQDYVAAYETKHSAVLSHACGTILHEQTGTALQDLSDAYNAFFLNQFIFRGHVLEHLVKRDPRIMVSSGKMAIDIETLLPEIYDRETGIRILSYFSNSLQMFSWQQHDLVSASA